MDKVSKYANLNELKDKLRIKYPQLTDSDMQHEAGKEESMFRMLEYKLSLTKPEMKQIIDGL